MGELGGDARTHAVPQYIPRTPYSVVVRLLVLARFDLVSAIYTWGSGGRTGARQNRVDGCTGLDSMRGRWEVQKQQHKEERWPGGNSTRSGIDVFLQFDRRQPVCISRMEALLLALERRHQLAVVASRKSHPSECHLRGSNPH